MIVNSPGCSRAIRPCAAATISSSPGCVLAASHTGRSPIRLPQRGERRRIGGERRGAGLQIADARHGAGAERAEPRRLLLVLRQAQREGTEHRPRPAPASRASAPTTGPTAGRWPAASGCRGGCVASTRLGHSSDSTQIARSGRQWSRNRSTARGRSTGTNWCRARRGNRSASSRAEATVPVVSSTSMPGRSASMRSISASTDCASPTLAACTQTSVPARARSAGRSRSARRAAPGPPCRAGRARADSAAPAAPRRR